MNILPPLGAVCYSGHNLDLLNFTNETKWELKKVLLPAHSPKLIFLKQNRHNLKNLSQVSYSLKNTVFYGCNL